MDEQKPTADTAASPATGSSSAPASPAAKPVGESAMATTVSAAPVPSSLNPASPIPPAPPAPVPPAPVQPSSPVQTAPTPSSAPVPGDGEKAVPTTAIEQPPKPLREDIARIIDKIKLPERIRVRMSGEKAKPTSQPPTPSSSAPTSQEKASAENATLSQMAGAAQASREDTGVQEERGSSVVSLHTLKDDLQVAVRDQKMSLVRAVALETEKKKGQEHLVGPRTQADRIHSHKLIGIVFVGTIVLAVAGIAFLGVKSVLERGTVTIQPSDDPSLMFAEKTVTFPKEGRTGTDLKRSLITYARNEASVPLGSVVHIIPTSSSTGEDGKPSETADSIGKFLNDIESHMTDELVRAFRGDFFFGLHQTAQKASPVLVIPVTSYERAFAGMLAWESTMNEDLAPIFVSVPRQMADEGELFIERLFQDTLINNYDIRALKDDSGAIRLLYSFPTRSILIISESPYSFTEVLSRLRASRQL